jgi:hypothetical protein
LILQRLCTTGAVLLLLAAAEAAAQSVAPKSSELAPFMGTWVFTMTNPQGSEQTVRIWDKEGVVGASLQVGKFPPNDITGILKDGDILVLTTTLRENGAPIWAVIALTLDRQTMNMAQMLQMSQTIKRGTAQKSLTKMEGSQCAEKATPVLGHAIDGHRIGTGGQMPSTAGVVHSDPDIVARKRARTLGNTAADRRAADVEWILRQPVKPLLRAWMQTRPRPAIV